MLSNTKSTTSGARPSDISSAMISAGGHRERARQSQHLLLTTGQCAGALAAALGEGGEQLVGTVDRARAARPRPDSAHGHAQVLLHREAGEDAATLRDVDQAGAANAVWATLRDVAAVERDPALERRGRGPRPRAASVLLPAPFAPSTATTEPSGTSSDTSNSACTDA